MKIALLHKRFDCLGGTERYVFQFANWLSEKGNDVTVVCQNGITENQRITIHKIKGFKKPSIAQVFSYAFGCQKFLQKNKFDAVFGFGKTIKQDIYRTGGGLHEDFLQKKMAYKSNHLFAKFNPLHQTIIRIEKQIFKKGNFQKIAAVSNMLKNDIMSKYSVPNEKIVVVHNGVNLRLFEPISSDGEKIKMRKKLNISDDKPICLFVGNDWRRKGLNELLFALSRLSKKPRLLVVGKGDINEYANFSKKLGLSAGDVIFIGATTNPLVYYQSADFFALPTWFDPFANVCLEAIACGLPVITTSQNGASEALDDNKDSLLLKSPNDIDSLLETISLLMDDKKLLEMKSYALSKRNSIGIEGNFSLMLKIAAGLDRSICA